MRLNTVLSAIAAFASALSAPAVLTAQQPTPPIPGAETGPVGLDRIVAVVGDQPITRIDLRERVLGRIQRKEVPEPTTDSATMALERSSLDDMIEEELLLQKANELKITVADADITPMVDRQISQVRAGFSTETEYRNALTQSGLGTPQEYRKYLLDQLRRRYTLEKTISKLKQDGKIVPVNVTDAEVAAEFERSKEYLPPKPASVTFKQIVIAPQASAAAKEVARVKAESLLARLKKGEDFETLAKRESMDPLTKETGGDMGWSRRGVYSPEVDRWLFGNTFQAALEPGQLSPVFESYPGFRILRVDRVQTGEVKAHEIMVYPAIDSSDIARTRQLADSVAKLWQSGVSFDTLAKKYHDYAGKEETSILTPFWRDSLPASYQQGFAGKKQGDIAVFQIPGASQRPDVPKFVVAQLLTVDEGGPQTLDELKSAVRDELAQRGGVRRYVDQLKKQTYVAIRLDDKDVADVPIRKP
jgi:peptidyl-prolyl cis-trans isomerase SurA